MSLRTKKGNIIPVLEKAMKGTTGKGGGQPKVCGGLMPVSQFEDFIHRFVEEWRTATEQIS